MDTLQTVSLKLAKRGTAEAKQAISGIIKRLEANMVKIPSGTFTMGCADKGCGDAEKTDAENQDKLLLYG